ncbi:terpenoid cyclases/protein prenyltransferase alpha-alpha toroid [Gigaspora rosea]|uniref:Geranylgeranyl transferase type-1 subunit beta n=1 Tax=Gigaspora rosea TaxID=44941 RepID=A0A397TUI1_9GLOM|nr:terpenoid cyclases/protein prenyltransferase alpha-alpha toroid [Gigaspora rosea]
MSSCNEKNSFNSANTQTKDVKAFDRDKTIGYLKRCLEFLPKPYESSDTHRLTLAFYSLSGLDLLGVLETEFTQERMNNWIDWIYAQQILPDENNPGTSYKRIYGLTREYINNKLRLIEIQNLMKGFAVSGCRASRLPFDASNLAMTYTALASLLILGDDLSRVDKSAIINAMKYLQKEDGSFTQTYQGMESDMRFVYCACAISYMLNDFSGINIDKVVQYIKESQSYDYGIGQGPGLESHGGSTYCAIASLYLLNKLDEGLLSKDKTIFWLISRQESGFQGRANKPPDACYSFWIGASLMILDSFEFIDYEQNYDFLMETRSFGGFAKCPGSYPDVMHTYMGVAGLSLMEESKKLDPALNISLKARKNLLKSVFKSE